MGNVQHKGRANGLTRFQRRKLKYDFRTFFDLNNDGFLTYNDFLWAKDKICFMSGWKIDSPKYKITEELFKEIWKSLEFIADVDKDGRISQTEWLAMWTAYKREIMAREKQEKDFLKKYYHHHKSQHGESSDDNGVKLTREESDEPSIVLDSDEETGVAAADDGLKEQKKPDTILEKFASHDTNMDESVLPKWLYKFLVFRFNLLDRTGDNVIDHEEFEYVLSEFGISEKDARKAFMIFTEHDSVRLDFDYFVHLFEEYYLSDDLSALGNFINGKLDFDGEDSDEEDPGLLDHHDHHKSSTSVHSMDDDLRDNDGKNEGKTKKNNAEEKQNVGRKIKAFCCTTS